MHAARAHSPGVIVLIVPPDTPIPDGYRVMYEDQTTMAGRCATHPSPVFASVVASCVNPVDHMQSQAFWACEPCCLVTLVPSLSYLMSCFSGGCLLHCSSISIKLGWSDLVSPGYRHHALADSKVFAVFLSCSVIL